MKVIRTLSSIDEPLDWLVENAWGLLLEHSEESKYMFLDDIYRILTDGYDERNYYDPKVLKMAQDEMLSYYKKEFPLLISKALRLIAEEINTGERIIDIQLK